MNLRTVDHYNIGLDLGTASVGWAVTDTEGELLRFKSKPTWGSRIYSQAKTAEATRLKRGQRRRYERRRWRLNLLQDIFAQDMAAVDEDFFIRLNQSRLLQEDRDSEHKMYHWPFFNATDFNEDDYYKRFPTIYHLRAWLMQTDEQADLRLIYLALHNIVKTRGNFLHQDNPSLSAEKSDMKSSVIDLCNVLKAWCDNRDIICSCKADEIESVLENIGDSRRSKQGTLELLFDLSSEDKKTIGKQISSALVGFVANFAQIFPGEVDDAKFKLSDDEKTDAYAETLSDEDRELFDAIRIVYFILYSDGNS